MRLVNVPTYQQVYFLTKPFSYMNFSYFREQLGVVENLFLGEREH